MSGDIASLTAGTVGINGALNAGAGAGSTRRSRSSAVCGIQASNTLSGNTIASRSSTGSAISIRRAGETSVSAQVAASRTVDIRSTLNTKVGGQVTRSGGTLRIGSTFNTGAGGNVTSQRGAIGIDQTRYANIVAQVTSTKCAVTGLGTFDARVRGGKATLARESSAVRVLGTINTLAPRVANLRFCRKTGWVIGTAIRVEYTPNTSVGRGITSLQVSRLSGATVLVGNALDTH